MLEGVIFHVFHRGVGQFLHGFEGQRSLYGQLGGGGGSVGELHTEAFLLILLVHPCPVFFNVGGVDHQQELILVNAIGEEVVHNAVLVVGEAAVLHLAVGQDGSVVGGHPLHKFQRFGPFDIKFTHVGHVKHADGFAHVEVFGHHAFVLDRHVESGELYHFRTQGFVSFCVYSILHSAEY